MRRYRLTLALLLVLSSATAATAADGPAPAGTSPAAPEGNHAAAPLRYRRVFAPVDREKDWPRGNLKYLPMDLAEFERLVSAARSSAPGASAQSAVRVVAAHYQARLTGEQELAGEATLEIAHTRSGPVLMPLEPCNLAISKPRWTNAEPAAVTLGLGSNGKLEALVERPGRLQFDWSLAGQREASDARVFSLAVPSCSVIRMTLDLPAKFTPAVDQGIVVESAPTGGEGLRRWQIELGGHDRFRLRLVPGGTAVPPARLALVRQSTAYDLSLRGLEVSAQWRIEVHGEPLPQIAVQLDSPLQPVSARCGDAQIPWTVASPPGSETMRLLLTLPQPIGQQPGMVSLKALAPLVTGRSWQLPRLRAEGLVWQGGGGTLSVPAPLVIEQLRPVGCRQSGMQVLPGPESGESVEFECFGPDAALAVTLAEHRGTARATSGVATVVGPAKATSRVTTDVRTNNATLFTLEAQVSPQWLVDSVESAPADAVEDWAVEEQGKVRKLTVRMARPVAPARPVRLTVAARRLYPAPPARLGIDDLLPLRFTVPTEGKCLVAVQAAEPYRLRSTGSERAVRLPPGSLSAAERELFGEQSPGELLLEDGPAAAGLQLAMENRRPAYSATVQTEAAAGGGMLRESYRIRCVPSESEKLRRVLVRFSSRRGAPPRWSVGTEKEQPFTAKPWTAGSDRAAASAAEETWELVFGRPQAGPLEIRAEREVQLAGPQAVSLASLPEATSQRATLLLCAPGPEALRITNSRLKPVPLEAVAPGRSQAVLAAYEYDSPDAMAAGPALLVSVADAAGMPPLWAWQADLHSRHAADGTSQHLAVYRLQSGGGQSLRLTLPAGVTEQDLCGLWVNGALLRSRSGDGGPLLVDLPAGEEFPVVAVGFITRDGPLGGTGRRASPWPETDIPVLARRWITWLPPGYEACDFLPRPPASLPPVSWQRRLLGPLGRAADQDPWPSFHDARETVVPLSPSEAAPTVWAAINLPGYEPADTAGWNSCQIEVSGTSPVVMVFVHRRTVLLLGIVIFLTVVAMGVWKAGNRPKVLAGATAGAAVLALVAPTAYAPLASSAVLGLLFCLVRYVFRRPRADRPPSRGAEPGSTDSEKGVLVPAILVVVFVALAAGPAWGAESEDRAPPPAPAWPVFIPVNDRQEPTGGKCYVPEKFYDELYRRAAARAEKPQGWLIAGATYRATLSKEDPSQQMAVESFSADFDLRVFGPATCVRIPFRQREVASLVPAECQLDGRVIEPKWEADGGALVVEIPEAGQYRLEIGLQPTVQSDGETAGFSLAIPRLATARLEIALPAGAPVVEVPSAAGPVRWGGQEVRLIADLGPAPRLTVRWPEASGGGSAPAIDVEELLWLKVQPGSVALEAKLKLTVAAGELRRLQLAADPALQLLPLAGADRPTVQIRRPAGQPQIIELQWPRPVTEKEKTVVEARFLLPGVSGVGSLRLPQLEVLGARPGPRWLAVSVDPSLDHQPTSGRSEAVPLPQFIGSWGAAATRPLFVCGLPSGPVQWNMVTRPRRAETTVEQKLDLIFDLDEVKLALDAQLHTTSGPVFQHRLAAPPGMRVEQLAVTANGTRPAVRWSQDPQLGTITLFFAGPISGRHELSLRGSLPARPLVAIPLPWAQLEDGRVESSVVRIFRRPAVLVTVSQFPGMVEESEVEPGRPELGRLVARFRTEGNSPPQATVTPSRNAITIWGDQIVRMHHDEGGWQATLDCRLLVKRGLMDRFRIVAPAAWNGPYQITSPISWKSPEGPGDDRRVLLEPRNPVTGDCRFAVSGPLEIAPSDRVAVPDISLAKIPGLRRIYLLPRQIEGRPAAWDVQGLRAIQLPPSAGGDPACDAYEAVGNEPQAVLRPAEPESQSPRVRRAEIRIAWQADGSFHGAAAFDVEPGRADSCPLWLPEGCSLLHATVAGAAAVPEATDPGKWRLPLMPEQSRQRVEVLFHGEAAAVESLFSLWGARRRFHAPVLGDLPVDQTLWTIAGPDALGEGSPEDAEPIGPEGGPATPRTRLPGGTTAPWQATTDGRQATVRCAVAGRAEALTVRYDAPQAGNLLHRLASIAAFVALAWGAAWLWRHGALSRSFARWPYAYGFAAGLAWWLWMWPAALGLAVAVLMAALHVAQIMAARQRSKAAEEIAWDGP